MRLHGLPPIIDAGVETLILGSFPSPASLAAQHYYAHPQNQFWRLLAALLGEPLTDLDYDAKQRRVLSRGIGIWDVYAACERDGALDSAIRAASPNDFGRLTREAPRLKRICFNGKTSARFVRQLEECGYETRVLPSTSPAYTLAFDAKLSAWREALAAAPEPLRPGDRGPGR